MAVGSPKQQQQQKARGHKHDSAGGSCSDLNDEDEDNNDEEEEDEEDEEENIEDREEEEEVEVKKMRDHAGKVKGARKDCSVGRGRKTTQRQLLMPDVVKARFSSSSSSPDWSEADSGLPDSPDSPSLQSLSASASPSSPSLSVLQQWQDLQLLQQQQHQFQQPLRTLAPVFFPTSLQQQQQHLLLQQQQIDELSQGFPDSMDVGFTASDFAGFDPLSQVASFLEDGLARLPTDASFFAPYFHPSLQPCQQQQDLQQQQQRFCGSGQRGDMEAHGVTKPRVDFF